MGQVTYQPPPQWQPPDPPTGDPVYVEEPYPYPQSYQPYQQHYATGAGHYYAPQYPYPYPYPYAYPQYPPPPPFAPRTPVRIAPPLVGYLLLACAVLSIASAFMPWAQVFGIAVTGREGSGDGNLTVFHGTVIGAMGVVIVCMQGRLWASIVASISAAYTVVIAFKDIADVNRFANSNGLDPSAVTVGPGLWLTLLAGLVAFGFGLVGIAKRAPRES
jgi:hypothetical protein